MLVDPLAIWNIAGRHFTEWFLSAAVLANFIYLRCTTRLSFLKVTLADAAITLLLTATLPISLLVVGLVSLVIPHVIKLDALTPTGLILVLLTFALISSASQSALLRQFKHKVTLTGFWLLVLVNAFCLALAFTWIYFHTGPAVA
jgi:hypothetical protein